MCYLYSLTSSFVVFVASCVRRFTRSRILFSWSVEIVYFTRHVTFLTSLLPRYMCAAYSNDVTFTVFFPVIQVNSFTYFFFSTFCFFRVDRHIFCRLFSLCSFASFAYYSRSHILVVLVPFARIAIRNDKDVTFFLFRFFSKTEQVANFDRF